MIQVLAAFEGNKGAHAFLYEVVEVQPYVFQSFMDAICQGVFEQGQAAYARASACSTHYIYAGYGAVHQHTLVMKTLHASLAWYYRFDLCGVRSPTDLICAPRLKRGDTPLTWACFHGRTEVVAWMIHLGVEVNAKYSAEKALRLLARHA